MAGFELILFTTQADYAREAEAAGVDAFIVDWEGIGKRGRQVGADTEVNADTPEDLSRIREAVTAPVICRINAVGAQTEAEVAEAADRGADEVLVPMVRSIADVQQAIEAAHGRCGVGILVETEDAVKSAAGLGQLPLARVYVGLNDLAIDRGADGIFEAVADGTVERIREHFRMPFGFGGLTLPDRGSPVPSRLLFAEMARLRTSFSFLRRSYRRDVPPGDQAAGVRAIRGALADAGGRDADEERRDHEELVQAVLAAATR